MNTMDESKFVLVRKKHRRAWELFQVGDINWAVFFLDTVETSLKGPFDTMKQAREALGPDSRVELGHVCPDDLLTATE